MLIFFISIIATFSESRVIHVHVIKFLYFSDEDGCRAIVTLENLPEHVDTCNYDPNAEIVCDRGCNLTMLRHEYNASSCLEHQKAEIDKVFARTFSRSRPNHQGEDDVFNLIDEIILDNWEEVDMDIDVVKDAKWQVFHNMKESADQDDQSNILECDTKSCYAFAQSFSFLETTKPYFRIEIVNLDCVKYVAIGLTSKDHPIDKIPGLHTGSLGYDNTGDLIVHNKCKNVDLRWKVGDIIECGIKFPSNFTNDGSTGVTLYFSRNKKLIAEENVKMPIDGFLPTVYMYEGIVGSMLGSGNVWSSNTSTKVKYFNN